MILVNDLLNSFRCGDQLAPSTPAGAKGTRTDACLARAVRVLSLYSRDQARQSARIAHGPAAALDLDDEVAGQAVEIVGLLFKAMLAQHSAVGSAHTQLGVQRERPSLYGLVEEMRRLSIPTLILHGDEDWPCLSPGILMKQNIALCRTSGHAELRSHHRGSLFSICTRVGPKAYFSANASMPEERKLAAMTSASARKRSRSSGAAP